MCYLAILGLLIAAILVLAIKLIPAQNVNERALRIPDGCTNVGALVRNSTCVIGRTASRCMRGWGRYQYVFANETRQHEFQEGGWPGLTEEESYERMRRLYPLGTVRECWIDPEHPQDMWLDGKMFIGDSRTVLAAFSVLR